MIPVQSGIFSEEDQTVLRMEVRRVNAGSALEFGPGVSTRTLLDAGCWRVASCEHTDKWFERARREFEAESKVTLYRYLNLPEAVVKGLPDAERFDIAFVDSPVGQGARRVIHPGQEQMSRFNTVKFALGRAPVVLLHDAHRPGEMATLQEVARLGFRVEVINTRKGIARISA